MPLLPPVTQFFGIDAAKFIAGVDEMLAGMDKLQASIDETVAAAGRLSGAGDVASAAEARMAEAADAVAVATDRQIATMDALAATMDASIAATDANTAAIDAQSVSLDANAASTGRAAGKSKVFGSVSKTAFLAIAGAAIYSVVKAAEYQSQMATLLTQAGVAKSQFAGLASGVLQLAGQVGFSPTSLAKALYHIESSFASVGITGPKALSLLRIAAEGAAVGHANLVDVTNALDATIASGVSGVKNYSQAMGALNAIVGSGDMTMQDLADAMGTGAMAQAKLFGQSIYQVGAALATLGDNNIRGAKAATDLRMTWQAIQSPMKAGVKVLADLGLGAKTLADTMTHHGLSAALQEFVGHLKASKVPMSDWGQIITEIFGKRAGTGIGVLTDQLSRLQGKLPDLKKGAEGFGSAWKTTQATVGQQFKEFRANLDTLAISFGQVLLPPVLKIMTALNKFFQVVDKHPLLMKIAGAIVAVVAAMGLLAGAMAAVEAVSSAFIPVLVIAAVAALAYGLYELYRHCKLVRDIVADVGHFFVSVWRAALEAAGAVVKWFTTGPLVWIKQQLAVFSQFWAQHGAEIKQVAKVVWGLIRDYIVTNWKITVDVIKAGLVVLRAIWNVAWVTIRDVAKTVWSVIGQVIHMWIQTILGIIGIGLDLITGKWGKAGHDLETLTSTIFHDVQHIIATIVSGWWHLLWDSATAMINGLVSGIRAGFHLVTGVLGDLAHAAVSAFKSVIPWASPSPLFIKIGGYITEGLATGIIRTRGQALDAARRLAAEVYAAFGSGQITDIQETELLTRIQVALQRVSLHIQASKAKITKQLRDWALEIRAGLVQALAGATSAGAVKSAIDKLFVMVKDAFNAGAIGYRRASGLTGFLERDNERLQTLANRRAAILKTIAAAEKYAAATASSIQSWAGLANLSAVSGAGSTAAPTSGTGTATGTLPGQAMTPGTTASTSGLSGASMLAGLQANLATIRRFASAIRRLASLGLSKDLLNQVIQMGPDQGLQVATALIDGPLSVIKSLNTTEAQITKASTALGQTAANAMYDSGKDAGKGFLSGLESQQKAIENLMRRIARVMVDTIRRELGIRSPSTVMAQHGMMAALGLAQGLDDGRGQVSASAARLALAVSAGGAGAGGGGTGGDTYHVTLHVSGFVGDEQELLRVLTLQVQKGILQLAKRNPSNMLSLASGRFG